MARALGIISFSNVHVEAMGDCRPIGAFSILGRYRMIDFPVSNMANSGIDRIQVYVKKRPRSLVKHLGTGRHYGLNSKSGALRVLFTDPKPENYDTDIAAYAENMEEVEVKSNQYIVIAPSNMLYIQDFSALLETHIASEADITVLYHSVDNAKDHFIGCNYVELNKQKGVEKLEPNRGNVKNRQISMDTYVMKKELFMELVAEAQKISSMYTLANMINEKCGELDVRGVAHKGYFAAITDFKSYYDMNMELLNYKTAQTLFTDKWPVYTQTNNSCPTQYFENADVKGAFVSNGNLIDGKVENSVIGRGCVIEKGAVIKDSIVLAGCYIGKDVVLQNQVVDKYAKINKVKELIATPENPGYVKRRDTI